MRPSTALHSRGIRVRTTHQRHRHAPSDEHHKVLANDGYTAAHRHAAKGPGARHHAVHAGHQPRAAHTPNPCPPACCSPIWLPRRSRLAGQPEEVGESSRGWRGGWVPDARGCPGGRLGRPRLLRHDAVDALWRWIRLAVTCEEERPLRRRSLPTANGKSFSIRFFTAARRWRVSMPPSKTNKKTII